MTMDSAPPLQLHEDRYFDPDPTVRGIARELYEETRDLPIVGPHGHVDPWLLAKDEPFPEPASLLIAPDHYVFRMLYSQGISLEELGIPERGDPMQIQAEPRRVWQLFAEHYYLFNGTPTGAWLDYELHHVFGVEEKLTGPSAQRVYDAIQERLREPDFRPRALFERFGIEVLTTTDAATSTLEAHRQIAESDLPGRVVPCFRPDALFAIASPAWEGKLEALAEQCDMTIDTFSGFIEALEDRRAFFKEMGATSTDHAVLAPHTERLSEAEAGRLFQRALSGEATEEDEAAFQAHMLMEMAHMSAEDGLVMQIHPGSFRNHNEALFRRYGPDKGGDIPVRTEYTRALHALLNAHGNDERFRLVVFTLDESTYARELAPLAGHYPALRLGPPWWFHDSIEGMKRFRRRTTETAGIYNTAGFNDDTRAFCSIPARHDLCRRVDANYLAGLVARHVIDRADAHRMARALAYDIVKDTYRLGDAADQR